MNVSTTTEDRQAALSRVKRGNDDRGGILFQGQMADLVAAEVIGAHMVPKDRFARFRYGIPWSGDFLVGGVMDITVASATEVLVSCWPAMDGDKITKPGSICWKFERSGSVVTLPTACSEPVIQKRHRGRLPAGVVLFHPFRMAKLHKEQQRRGLMRLRDESAALVVKLGDAILALEG